MIIVWWRNMIIVSVCCRVLPYVAVGEYSMITIPWKLDLHKSEHSVIIFPFSIIRKNAYRMLTMTIDVCWRKMITVPHMLPYAVVIEYSMITVRWKLNLYKR